MATTQLPKEKGKTISTLIRRKIVQALAGVCWYGDLDEIEFLSRLYKLDQLPSNDERYKDAAGDIYQHRMNNEDWDDLWIFSDDRFDLRTGSDETFLRFLAESVHPRLGATQLWRKKSSMM